MAYGDFKDLIKRKTSDKLLWDKAFDIAKYLKYDGYQRGLASVVYNFFDKKSTFLADKSTSGGGIKKQNIVKQKIYWRITRITTIIRKFKREKHIHVL